MIRKSTSKKSTAIKICGITMSSQARAIAQLRINAIGVIGVKSSPRFVPEEECMKIFNEVEKVSSSIEKVLAIANEKLETIQCISKRSNKPSVLQLHGNEDPAYAAKLVRPFIKSIRVKDKSDLDIMSQFVNTTFLLDSFNANLFGGTGAKFDWGLIPQRKRNNIILAGGVSRYNVGEIIEEIKPYAVDVSSSIEIEPGKKDHKKMEELFRVFREAGG